MGIEVWGLGVRVWGLRFGLRVHDLKVEGLELGFGVQGQGFEVLGLGISVWGLESWGLGFRITIAGFRVPGSGLNSVIVKGSGFRSYRPLAHPALLKPRHPANVPRPRSYLVSGFGVEGLGFGV